MKMSKKAVQTDQFIGHLISAWSDFLHESLSNISPKGIVRFRSCNKAVAYVFSQKTEPSSATRTGQYLLDWYSTSVLLSQSIEEWCLRWDMVRAQVQCRSLRWGAWASDRASGGDMCRPDLPDRSWIEEGRHRGPRRSKASPSRPCHRRRYRPR